MRQSENLRLRLRSDHLAQDKDHFYRNDEIIEKEEWSAILLEITQN